MRRAKTITLAALIATLCHTLSATTNAAERESDNALRAYHSGNGLLNRGLYDLAADEYRTFLKQHPAHDKAPTARYGLAVSLFRLGRFDDAATEFARLAERRDFEFAAEVSTILGQCRLAQKKYDASAAAFETVVSDHRGHELADDAAAGWAEALYLAGKHDDALERCRAFAGQWPGSPLRDRVAYFQGLSEMAGEDYAAAAATFEQLLRRDSDSPFADEAALLRAECQHHTGALEQAAASYRRVIEQAAEDRLPDALLGLATVLVQQSAAASASHAERSAALDEAGRLLDRLIKQFPNSPLHASALQRRGRVWFELERFDKAFDAFRLSAETDPDVAAPSAYWTAKCRLRQGKFADAAERLGHAIDTFPDSGLLPQMHYDRAVALVRSNRLEAAADVLNEFISRFSKHPLAADALYLLATTQHRRKAYNDCRRHCAAFVDQYPTHPHAPAVAFLSAENEFLQARYEPAAKAFRDFLDHHPDDPRSAKARHRLGIALYRLGRLDEAETYLAEAVRELGTDGALAANLLALGDIAFQRGAWKTAERQLEHYLASHDTPPYADDALLKLGIARQRQDRAEDALAAYDQLLRRFDESPHRLQAVFERGQALLALDRSRDAAKAFETVLTDGPDSRFVPYARNHLGAIAIHNKDFDAAADLFDKVALSMTGTDMDAAASFQRGVALLGAQRFDEADTTFSDFLKNHADHPLAPRAHAQRAIALARLDRYKDALRVIKHIENRDAERLDPSLRTAVQYEKAWCLRKTGRTRDAADVYRRLLDQSTSKTPTSPRALHAMLELARIEMDDKHYDTAADLLRRLGERLNDSKGDPDHSLIAGATYAQAVCAFELSRFPEAADLFETFLADAPADDLVASASFFCGEALFNTDRQRRAVPYFTRVVDDFASDPAYAAALLRLGECQSVLQRWAKSERRFTQYLDRLPDTEQWFRATFGVGWARENQKRYNDAIDAYRKVVDRHEGPTAARAQFQIGECLFAARKYQEAARALLKVDILYAYPEWSAAALFEAGRCFEKLDKPVEARDQFKQVVQKYGQTRWAPMAVRHLDAVASGGLPGR